MSAVAPPLVTAIVVAHDSAEALPACLAALNEEGVPTVVVDNASSDGSAAIAGRFGAQVVRNRRNEGYGRANNIGARAVGSAYLLVCNPDVRIEAGAVAALLEAAGRYPDAALFAPQIVEPSGRVFFQPRSLLAPYLDNPRGPLVLPQGDACVPFASGSCFLVRRDVFLRLGGFDEAIFLFYEDDDLCRRIADAGHALVYVPAAVARHGRGRSSAPMPGRIYRSRWHQAWSRAYVSRKYCLRDPALLMVLENGVKALGAGLVLRRDLIERYAGSAAGALAWLMGRSALAREALPERLS